MPDPAKKKKSNHEDLLEIFHNNKPLCQIVPTSSAIRPLNISAFRPEPGACLDYHISQTDAKLDAGPTKIHLRTTEATYEWNPEPHAPKRRRPIRWSSGGPAQFEFVDELWRKKRSLENVGNFAAMMSRQKRKRYVEKNAKGKLHNEIVRMMGPAWYQELSPNQLRTIDTLKKCIARDLELGVIDNVKENMASLGLVLRPNPRHLLMALKECCHCPIEFLLILYQLSNPKRKNYSINDRLLLSSVVHLTMRKTLRELHVRIPSPPPPQPEPKCTVKPIKRPKWDSPYLEPFTFERTPPKWTGIYYNKHVQWPESIYFDYLIQLKKDLKENRPQTIDDFESEMLIEANYAQKVYEDLVDYRPVRILLPPSKYDMCYNYRNPLPVLVEETVSEILPEVDTSALVVDDVENEEVTKELVYVDINEDGEIVEETVSGKAGDEHKSTQNQHTSTATGENQRKSLLVEETGKEISFKDQGIIEDVELSCREASKKFIEKPLCPCERCCRDRQRKQEIYNKYRKKKQELVAKRLKDECICDEEAASAIELPGSINESVVVDEDEESENEDAGIESCDCYKKYKEKIQAYEAYQKRLAIIIKQKKLSEKYLISGVTVTVDGPIYQIGGIAPKFECFCADRAKEKQSQQQKMALMPKIPPGRVKYQIGGVHATPEGNVYILNQAIPMDDCVCLKTYEEFEKRHERCLEVYEKFKELEDKHIGEYKADLGYDFQAPTRCDVLEEVSLDTDCYGYLDKVSKMEEQLVDGTKCTKCMKQVQTTCCGQIEEKPVDKCVQKVQTCCGQTQVDEPKCIEVQTSCCGPCGPKKEEEIVEAPVCCGKKTQVVKDVKKKSCCEPTPPPSPPKVFGLVDKGSPCGFIDPPEPEIVEEEEVEIVEEPFQLKRYFIRKKILCARRWQMKLLKKALASMAEDGYPLAKLPECYKLPHFKLWMQLRCGKFWTKADADQYVLYSRRLWRHTEKCYEKIRTPKLPITNEEARTYTWRNAPTVKKMTRDAILLYYRKVRQQFVNLGREYFPTVYNYEFPFWTFRDCFFSYIPAKEEEVIAVSLWQPHERHR